MHGYVADIVKAFNHIPRYPVYVMAEQAGVPGQVLTPWKAAHSQLRRRFKVRQFVSREVASTTGMPEGDPLSCLGMILCDFYFHCYFSRYLPSIYVFSYVDNLSLISTQVPLLVQGGTGFPSLAPNAGLVAGSQKKLWVEHLSTGSEDSGWKWLHYPIWGSRPGSTTSVWHQSSGVIQR